MPAAAGGGELTVLAGMLPQPRSGECGAAAATPGGCSGWYGGRGDDGDGKRPMPVPSPPPPASEAGDSIGDAPEASVRRDGDA